MGMWKNYDPLEELTRANIERGISKWVIFLKDKGMLNGELSFVEELTECILEQFEPDKEGD